MKKTDADRSKYEWHMKVCQWPNGLDELLIITARDPESGKTYAVKPICLELVPVENLPFCTTSDISDGHCNGLLLPWDTGACSESFAVAMAEAFRPVASKAQTGGEN